MKRLIVFALLAAGCRSGSVRGARLSINVTPPVLDFGNVRPGASSKLVVTISNDGQAALHVSKASIVHDVRSTFQLGAFPDALQDLRPSQSATLSVTYVGAGSEGADGASLILETDVDSARQVAVSLVGGRCSRVRPNRRTVPGLAFLSSPMKQIVAAAARSAMPATGASKECA